jgi:hypothetical protein
VEKGKALIEELKPQNPVESRNKRKPGKAKPLLSLVPISSQPWILNSHFLR